MTRWSCLMLLGLTACLCTLSGCSKSAPVGIPHTHHEEFEVTLCGLCGDIKQDAHVCKEGAKICPNCGLHKGSILCCSSAFTGAPRDVILCRKCGEKLLAKKCCQEGIAICPKCGLHKNSPGCCKIEKAVDDGTGHAEEAAHDGHAGWLVHRTVGHIAS